MKRFLTLLFSAAFLVACQSGDNPWSGSLLSLTVEATLPDTLPEGGNVGATVSVEEISSGARYKKETGSDGTAVFSLQSGIYRISVNNRIGRTVYNASADKIRVTEDRRLALALSISEAGTLVVKELYTSGCSKAPEEGTYQSDQYVILHNNDDRTVYLDSLCFGTLSPYNSTAVNSWLVDDSETGSKTFPDFVPVVTVVWKFPGDGSTYPLEPGEDALIALRGAIDHSAAYPLSVNLNRSDCFVCYNSTLFPNTVYHPAPGDQIRQDHILEVLVKTGQSNANTISLSSPTFVIFKSKGIAMEDYILLPGVVQSAPGNTADRAVTVPYDWLLDAVEVFDGRSSNNSKRLAPAADAGFVVLTDVFKSHSIIRNIDEEATRQCGYEILVDTNNSSNDFYESEIPSLRR